MPKQEQSADDDGSTLALKPMARVNQSPKQRVPVTPQNSDLSPQKIKQMFVSSYLPVYVFGL